MEEREKEPAILTPGSSETGEPETATRNNIHTGEHKESEAPKSTSTTYATAVKKTTNFVQCNIENAAQLIREAKEKITIEENGEFRMKDTELHEAHERMVTYTSISNTKKPTALTQEEIKCIFKKKHKGHHIYPERPQVLHPTRTRQGQYNGPRDGSRSHL
ncbi:hypothetical protein Ahia01_000178400 [Argonauta hians]